jgi:hypothetical protein
MSCGAGADQTAQERAQGLPSGDILIRRRSCLDDVMCWVQANVAGFRAWSVSPFLS